MKRTGEIVLSIIGIIVSVFIALMGIVLVFLRNNEGFLGAIEEGIGEEDPNVSSSDINIVIDLIFGYFWALVIVSILGIILGIIAVVFLIRNKSIKTSGIILLVTAVVVGIFSIPFGLLSGLFYLIAGIMCLARKPQPELEQAVVEES